MTRSKAITPMQRDDVPEVAALFQRVFRKGAAPSAEFQSYFEESFFGSPSYSEAEGGLVHRDANGLLDSALLVIPMQVRVNGQAITGRLMSNYMTDPAKRTRGGADMVLTIRARNQVFCFSDSANPLSADHWKAVGGHVLPIQSPDWRHVLRPAARFANRAAAKLPPRRRASPKRSPHQSTQRSAASCQTRSRPPAGRGQPCRATTSLPPHPVSSNALPSTPSGAPPNWAGCWTWPPSTPSMAR
ncbi:GNAT family N-acetyltransferase [Devosia sp. A8/3-2]|nr:GNAT family N-acetyltransferase [Devosia sp. A8/3-2]